MPDLGVPPTQNEARRVREWRVDVCKSCARLAQWPFCKHYNAMDGTWFETVNVREIGNRRG